MYEFEAVFHLVLFENVERFEQFARIEAELADIATRIFPLAAARAGQLDADTDVGAYFQPFGNVGNEVQLVEFFDNEEDASAHFLCQEGQLNVVFVFIAVADDERVGIDVDGQHGMQFGFGTGFESDV